MEIQHGRAAFVKNICRCDICRDAHNEYNNKWRHERRVDRLDPEPIIEVSLNSPTFAIRSKTLQNILENGIDVFLADKYCVEMGYHPMQLYGFKFYKEAKRPSGYVERV